MSTDELLARIPAQINTGLIVLDPSQRITFWNDWMEKYTGKIRQEVEGIALSDLYPHFQKPLYLSLFKQALEQGKPVFCSGALHGEIIPPGTSSPYSRQNLQIDTLDLRDERFLLLQVFDIANQQKRVQLLKEEVTKRTRAENALRASTEKLRLMTRNMHDVVIECDSSGIYTYISPSHQTVLGRGSEMLGRSVFEHIHPDDGDRLITQFNQFITRRREERVEYRYLHPTRGVIWLESIGSTYLNRDSKTVVLVSSRDITERRRADEKIRYMSFHDKLTGLYNRAFLDEETERLDTARQLPLTVIMADLNGLKLVNDTYGHARGDKLLQSAAEALQQSCRREDIIARWGGDEFIILLPQTDASEGWNICKRILENCRLVSLEDMPLSMALGLAVKQTAHQEMATTFKEAEDNMYRHKLTESFNAKNAVLGALLKSISEKNYETEAHTRCMQKVAQLLGRKLELPETELKRLDLLITLHDIGKIRINEEILTKNETLDRDEWEMIKQHPETGYRIARSTEDFAHIAEDILTHHEHWNGEGYPMGLKGTQIPLLARITAIADAFEVMSNGRPYRAAMKKDEIMEEIKNCAGKQFDPHLVEQFLELQHQL